MPHDPRAPTKPAGLADPPPHRPGQTTPVQDAVPAPKQPHERDESADSQQAAPSDRMQQAHDDVERGVVDTSRAEATDQTYERVLRSEPQAPVPAARTAPTRGKR